MKRKVMLFAGTKEGRLMAEFLKEKEIEADVFVATEYGESLIEGTDKLHVETGRMDGRQMEQKLHEERPGVVIDATHPYASLVTRNIREACERADITCLRLRRESVPDETVIWMRDAAEAAAYLQNTEGAVLVTTGSKEVEAFTIIPGYEERLVLRILPVPAMLEKCLSLGIPGRHMICMQGPFSEQMNLSTIKDFDIRYLVTKESGVQGGFPEKISAARKAGISVIGIRRPEEESGYSMDEIKNLLMEAKAWV